MAEASKVQWRASQRAKLPDACQQAATKSRQIRAPPPLRKRSQASVEQFERRVTRHKSKPLRRSKHEQKI
ncbi:uncharacterized protein PITG_16848 [Phytophthora infestans T30-4]|uniref:Uncharacterized protein n=1 Tax=Phytophthora infestans (strain T30-4) TaxID=403677 RepID=D0NU89_PHYIT|nr:uncharacterized protein PITG_16848 [Phytophthora infestans T30-4]EEY65222.1 hypothetical protein PITG_16848 [Phytophthora infestans T30-4]|eukprot:XP_002897286.1 hypothetical protein PITG_16848 [Phytophthora infestans T30-4]